MTAGPTDEAGANLTETRSVEVRGGLAAIPGPEVLAAVAVVLVAVLAFGVLGGPASVGPVGPTASPGPSDVVVTPSPHVVVDRAIADLLIIVNEQLIETSEALTAELGRDPSRTTEISTLIREVNGTARYGADALPALGTTAEALAMIERLGTLYADLRVIAAETLRSSINNDDAYRRGAERLVDRLAALPAIQLELAALKDMLVVATEPPLASPTPTRPPTATPTTGPTASPSRTDPPPTASAAAGSSQVINGGFEEGVDTAWTLYVAPDGSATMAADDSDPANGSLAARVAIGAATPAYSGVSVRQEGIRLVAGASYTISVALRADAPRDVRVRVASLEGDAYLTRITAAGPTWTTASFTFLAPASDDAALIEIDLGRSDVTTWIDEVSLRSGQP